MRAKVLLTGGAGYVGSHTYVALIEAGYDVVILDDFSNSTPDVIHRLEQITGRNVAVVCGDVRDAVTMDTVFDGAGFDAVIHFAARKSIPQSIRQPEQFLAENILGLLTLIETMDRHKVETIVYSSSATVYGQPEALPIPEHAPLSYTNPYGHSKLLGEQYLTEQSSGGVGCGDTALFQSRRGACVCIAWRGAAPGRG